MSSLDPAPASQVWSPPDRALVLSLSGTVEVGAKRCSGNAPFAFVQSVGALDFSPKTPSARRSILSADLLCSVFAAEVRQPARAWRYRCAQSRTDPLNRQECVIGEIGQERGEIARHRTDASVLF